MSTHAVGPRPAPQGLRLHLSQHWYWLLGAFALAFLVPFVLADVLALQRDLFYGLYAAGVVAMFVSWSRSTGCDLRFLVERRWPWALGLGLAVGGVLAVMVLRTESSTPRPDGLELVGAVVWRGVVYGLADGLLLSAFPILVVFAAMAGTRLNQRFRGQVVIGAIAMVASLAMTAVYHAGYSDFRSEKIRKPVAGDVVWSIPTLVTLNPIGAPIAHASMHTTAVLHSYETETFLPPH